jgi:hypothetical protein
MEVMEVSREKDRGSVPPVIWSPVTGHWSLVTGHRSSPSPSPQHHWLGYPSLLPKGSLLRPQGSSER